MKIRDIVTKVNKSERFKSYVSFDDLSSKYELGIPEIDQEDQERLTSYFIGNWYCTDRYVGYKIYFFDDKPVAISTQLGRKMSEDIEWLSKEAFLEVKKYLLTFIHSDENIMLADKDQDIGETYKIEFNEQLFDYHHDIPLYQGEHVIIIGLEKRKELYGTDSRVKIKFDNGDEMWIDVNQLDFPYNIIN